MSKPKTPLIYKWSSLGTMPSRQYICQRLGLMVGTTNLLCAEGYSGKTLLTQYLAVCIATGKPFLGYPVEQGLVVHVDNEQSEWMTNMRYERIGAGMGMQEGDSAPLGRITLESRIDDPIHGDRICNDLRDACKGAKLVIIDSLKSVTCADENSSAIEQPMRKLKLIAQSENCAVLLIHHKGKHGGNGKQSGRGSSAIYDAVDMQWDLAANNDDYTLVCKKNRCGKPLESLSYTLVDAGEYVANHDTTSSLVFRETMNSNGAPDERDARVLEFLEERGTANYSALKTFVKSQIALDKILARLLASGKIIEHRGSKNSRNFSIA